MQPSLLFEYFADIVITDVLKTKLCATVLLLIPCVPGKRQSRIFISSGAASFATEQHLSW